MMYYLNAVGSDIVRRVTKEQYDETIRFVKNQQGISSLLFIEDYRLNGIPVFGVNVAFSKHFPAPVRDMVEALLRELALNSITIPSEYAEAAKRCHIRDRLKTRQVKGIQWGKHDRKVPWQVTTRPDLGTPLQVGLMERVEHTLTPEMLSLLYGEGGDQ